LNIVSWYYCGEMMPSIFIDEDICKECRICVEFCPVKIIEIAEYTNKYGYHPAVVTDESKCVLCYLCERYCPEFAIVVKK